MDSGACLRGTGPPLERCRRRPRGALASAGPLRTVWGNLQGHPSSLDRVFCGRAHGLSTFPGFQEGAEQDAQPLTSVSLSAAAADLLSVVIWIGRELPKSSRAGSLVYSSSLSVPLLLKSCQRPAGEAGGLWLSSRAPWKTQALRRLSGDAVLASSPVLAGGAHTQPSHLPPGPHVVTRTGEAFETVMLFTSRKGV